MSVLLYIVGAIAVMLGVGMVGYGIPINEFSFGNTLIVAGTTAAVGGLIVIAVGAAVAQLQRISEALATRTPVRSSRPFDTFEPAAGSRAAPAPGRIPFPPKPKSDAGIREPHPSDQHVAVAASANMPVDDRPAAPTLRNPDIQSVTIEEYEEASLSPQYPMAAPAPSAAPLGVNGSGMAEKHHEAALDSAWRSPPPPASQPQARQPQTSYFDAMWPAESKPAKSPVGNEARPETMPDLPPRETAAAPAQPAETERHEPDPGNEARAVAILKSGAVDGMGYTLYVDGSIEAELPQGTLRFASINDLREHLAKNS
jgi:hypothetical protein